MVAGEASDNVAGERLRRDLPVGCTIHRILGSVYDVDMPVYIIPLARLGLEVQG